MGQCIHVPVSLLRNGILILSGLGIGILDDQETGPLDGGRLGPGHLALGGRLEECQRDTLFERPRIDGNERPDTGRKGPSARSLQRNGGYIR